MSSIGCLIYLGARTSGRHPKCRLWVGVRCAFVIWGTKPEQSGNGAAAPSAFCKCYLGPFHPQAFSHLDPMFSLSWRSLGPHPFLLFLFLRTQI